MFGLPRGPGDGLNLRLPLRVPGHGQHRERGGRRARRPKLGADAVDRAIPPGRPQVPRDRPVDAVGDVAQVHRARVGGAAGQGEAERVHRGARFARLRRRRDRGAAGGEGDGHGLGVRAEAVGRDVGGGRGHARSFARARVRGEKRCPPPPPRGSQMTMRGGRAVAGRAEGQSAEGQPLQGREVVAVGGHGRAEQVGGHVAGGGSGRGLGRVAEHLRHLLAGLGVGRGVGAEGLPLARALGVPLLRAAPAAGAGAGGQG
ncbi:MAG: hypothetical protein ACK559_27375, partial [bacterium]